VDADRGDTAAAEFAQDGPFDRRLDAGVGMVDPVVNLVGNVAIECRHGDGSLAGRRHERRGVEAFVLDAVEEAAPFEAGLGEADGVVRHVGVAFERLAFDLCEVVEPLLWRAVELACVVALLSFGLAFRIIFGLGVLCGLDPALVFALEGGCEQFLDAGVDVAPQPLDCQVGTFREQLCAPAETRRADGRALGQVRERGALRRHEYVAGGGPFWNPGDDQF